MHFVLRPAAPGPGGGFMTTRSMYNVPFMLFKLGTGGSKNEACGTLKCSFADENAPV